MNGSPDWTVERRRDPIGWESLDGYLARIAAIEGLPNLLELTTFGGSECSADAGLSRRPGADWTGIAERLKVDPEELAARAYPLDGADHARRRFFGSSFDVRLLVRRTRAFSPLSLSKAPVHRATWDLRLFPFDDEEWDHLATTCPDPECAATQRWYHTQGVELCDRCGEPLARARTAPVPSEDQGPLRRALGLVHPDPERRSEALEALPTALRHLPAGDALEILAALSVVVQPSMRRDKVRTQIGVAAPAETVSGAVAEAWRIMEAWPHGFERLATDRLASRPTRHGDGNKGATMNFLDLPATGRLRPPAAEVLQAERRRLVAAQTRGVGARGGAVVPHIKTQVLVSQRRAGLIPTVFAIVNDRAEAFVDRAFVEELSAQVAATSPSYTASSRLGISHNGLERLLGGGLLRGGPFPTWMVGEDELRIETASIDRLIGDLAAAAGPSRRGWKPLEWVLRGIGGRLKPWRSVLEAMLSGAVPFSIAEGVAPLTTRLEVSVEAFDTFAALHDPETDYPHDHGMTCRDALATLNLPSHSPAIADRWRSSRLSARCAPVEEVLAVSAAGISLRELCVRLDRSPIDCRWLLDRHGLAHRDSLYDRAAVECATGLRPAAQPVFDSTSVPG